MLGDLQLQKQTKAKLCRQGLVHLAKETGLYLDTLGLSRRVLNSTGNDMF